MANLFRQFFLGAACSALLAAVPAGAGEFAVNPIRLELGAAAHSGAIIVRNDGKEKLSFQLQAMEWTQDGAGLDQYAETRDLVFFPKILTVEAAKEGVIRVGIKSPAIAAERTYRLFIEELPGLAEARAANGAQINVLVRFGEPIFVTPAKAQDSLEIENPGLHKGALTFSARNTGNRHQFVHSIELRGTDARGVQVYALTLADRYLLAGTVKPYTASIAGDQCSKIAALEIEVRTDKAIAKRRLDVNPAMCS
jgi:fimbrial chaperone protein